MKPEGSLPHSQVPATCPYPEPARPSPLSHICVRACIYITSLRQIYDGGEGNPCFTPVRPNRLNPLNNVMLNLVQLVRILK